MSSANTKFVIGFVLLCLVGAGAAVGFYLNNEKQDPHKTLLPLVLGSWVKIPGICEGNVSYQHQLDILSKELIKIKGEEMSIADFSISETASFKVTCEAVGSGEFFAQTSFIADRFSRFYVGKIGQFTVMKNVAPTGELWFKLDSQFQKKLQAMSDIKNSRRI
ncbi:hypothetical protein [Shewanella sp. UCD-KL12]|uniref:hypothetical protein n=1 Tax=Shewanella sp. UCD-KL12 TaxID=1917163 RepID=UPI00097041B6|nr:hypothetical protein [Shewanella sp. UCD-KL12]